MQEYVGDTIPYYDDDGELSNEEKTKLKVNPFKIEEEYTVIEGDYRFTILSSEDDEIVTIEMGNTGVKRTLSRYTDYDDMGNMSDYCQLNCNQLKMDVAEQFNEVVYFLDPNDMFHFFYFEIDGIYTIKGATTLGVPQPSPIAPENEREAELFGKIGLNYETTDKRRRPIITYSCKSYDEAYDDFDIKIIKISSVLDIKISINDEKHRLTIFGNNENNIGIDELLTLKQEFKKILRKKSSYKLFASYLDELITRAIRRWKIEEVSHAPLESGQLYINESEELDEEDYAPAQWTLGTYAEDLLDFLAAQGYTLIDVPAEEFSKRIADLELYRGHLKEVFNKIVVKQLGEITGIVDKRKLMRFREQACKKPTDVDLASTISNVLGLTFEKENFCELFPSDDEEKGIKGLAIENKNELYQINILDNGYEIMTIKNNSNYEIKREYQYLPRIPLKESITIPLGFCDFIIEKQRGNKYLIRVKSDNFDLARSYAYDFITIGDTTAYFRTFSNEVNIKRLSQKEKLIYSEDPDYFAELRTKEYKGSYKYVAGAINCEYDEAFPLPENELERSVVENLSTPPSIYFCCYYQENEKEKELKVFITKRNSQIFLHVINDSIDEFYILAGIDHPTITTNDLFYIMNSLPDVIKSNQLCFILIKEYLNELIIRGNNRQLSEHIAEITTYNNDQLDAIMNGIRLKEGLLTLSLEQLAEKIMERKEDLLELIKNTEIKSPQLIKKSEDI